MPAKLVLWKCPEGEHTGVRAPTRPRKDDIRRFCIPCSEASGRLTERISPVVEKERARKEAARKRKEATKRRRASKKAKTARVSSPTSYPDTLNRMYQAMVTSPRQYPMLRCLYEFDVKLQVIKRRVRASEGKCEYKAKQIVVKAGTFAPGGRLQLIYQACRFVAHLGGRGQDNRAIAKLIYQVARATYRDFEVEHWQEPDLVEVMQKLLVQLSRVAAREEERRHSRSVLP